MTFPGCWWRYTVCTAALTRRAALVEVGGFDSGMPVAGYEDWDLAISLVERGLSGTVIPEYLFRYRIRKGSMSSSCTASGNHALLMRYLVEKHAESYGRFLPGSWRLLRSAPSNSARRHRHRGIAKRAGLSFEGNPALGSQIAVLEVHATAQARVQ